MFNITRITLRINDKTHKKLIEICKNSKRSLNGQIDFILESYIKDYEKLTGEIKIKD